MFDLAIIVPYRDREEHLKKFIPHMNKFLENKIKFKIYIIEQLDNQPFNRAKLLNIGFDLFKNEHDYFCFHDIDLLPVDNNCDYSLVEGVCKLSYYVSQFNFAVRPHDELGGVTLIDKNNFLIVNGYSNLYYGWGVEDNDFGLRCKVKNIPFHLRKGRYMSLNHVPNGDTYGDKPSEHTLKNRKMFSDISKNLDLLFQDGLNTLKYELIENKNNISHYHIKVKL